MREAVVLIKKHLSKKNKSMQEEINILLSPACSSKDYIRIMPNVGMSTIKQSSVASRSADMFNNINIDRSSGLHNFVPVDIGYSDGLFRKTSLPSDSELSFELYNLGMHPFHVLLGLSVMFIFLQIPISIIEKGLDFFVIGILLLLVVFLRKFLEVLMSWSTGQ